MPSTHMRNFILILSIPVLLILGLLIPGFNNIKINDSGKAERNIASIEPNKLSANNINKVASKIPNEFSKEEMWLCYGLVSALRSDIEVNGEKYKKHVENYQGQLQQANILSKIYLEALKIKTQSNLNGKEEVTMSSNSFILSSKQLMENPDEFKKNLKTCTDRISRFLN